MDKDLRVSLAEENMAERQRGRRNEFQTMDDSELIRRYRLTPGLKVNSLIGLTVNAVPLFSRAFSFFLVLIPCLLH